MTSFSGALTALIEVLWKLVKIGLISLLAIIVFKIAFNVLYDKYSRRKK